MILALDFMDFGCVWFCGFWLWVLWFMVVVVAMGCGCRGWLSWLVVVVTGGDGVVIVVVVVVLFLFFCFEDLMHSILITPRKNQAQFINPHSDYTQKKEKKKKEK